MRLYRLRAQTRSEWRTCRNLFSHKQLTSSAINSVCCSEKTTAKTETHSSRMHRKADVTLATLSRNLFAQLYRAMKSSHTTAHVANGHFRRYNVWSVDHEFMSRSCDVRRRHIDVVRSTWMCTELVCVLSQRPHRCPKSASYPTDVLCGLPEWSAIGSVLFLLHAADLLQLVESTNLCPHLLRGTAVERRSLAVELSRSCARPVPDGWSTTYVGKPSATGQPTRPTQLFTPLGSINEQ